MAVARQTKKAGQRATKPFRYGKADLRINLNRRYLMRFFWLRAERIELLHNVEAVTWTDANEILTGSLTTRDPGFGLGPDLRVLEGDRIYSEIDRGGGWRPYWLMRVRAPDLDVRVGQRTYELANDLDLLRRSTDDFIFFRNKAHPKGWYAHEVIAQVCRSWGVPLVVCPKMKARVHTTFRNTAPTEVIRLMMRHEYRATGHLFRVRWDFLPGSKTRQGLYIEPLKRSPHLLLLGASIIDARFKSALPDGSSGQNAEVNNFASAVTMRGLRSVRAPEFERKDKKGHVKKKYVKLHAYLKSPAAIRRYGYVRRVLWSPDAKTRATLVREGRQWLSIISKPVRQVEITDVLMPDLSRGDAIRLGLGDKALRRQIVYVKEIAHTFTPSEQTSVVTCFFDDPYIDNKAERIVDKLQATQEAAQGRVKKTKASATKKGKQRKGSTFEGEYDRAAARAARRDKQDAARHGGGRG